MLANGQLRASSSVVHVSEVIETEVWVSLNSASDCDIGAPQTYEFSMDEEIEEVKVKRVLWHNARTLQRRV